MLLRIVSVCYETLFQSARALMGNMEWWELLNHCKAVFLLVRGGVSICRGLHGSKGLVGAVH